MNKKILGAVLGIAVLAASSAASAHVNVAAPMIGIVPGLAHGAQATGHCDRLLPGAGDFRYLVALPTHPDP